MSEDQIWPRIHLNVILGNIRVFL
uniref:Uncharacterized protein n=1 Tax=Rhizophora mucronata TaxID=61149 RepID=A0A2P2NRE8_RHIMU